MSGESAPVSRFEQDAPSRTGALFATIFIVAAALAAVIVWLGSSGLGVEGDVKWMFSVIITALVVDAGLISALIGLVGWRIMKVLRSREAGSRMQLRYMSLFALAAAVPDRVIAACNGACFSITFVGHQPKDNAIWVYLETIGGGSGARAGKDGLDGVHVHMTNTSNLPVEALEIENVTFQLDEADGA